MNPKYPIYIVTKGRWEFGLRLTSRALEKMNVPYRIVVEPPEYDNYAAVIDPAKILTLPKNFRETYRGDPQPEYGGSIPARNYIWHHALTDGWRRHWILDDNIQNFERLNRNERTPVTDGSTFAAVEDYVERYTHVALAAMAYRFHAPSHAEMPPYYRNLSRIQSCILVDNDIPYAFRGRFNEDVDLAIRVLKDGYCTMIFNAFLADKVTSRRKRGGNTDGVYADDPYLWKKAASLARQHPDVAKVVWRRGHWHHQVNCEPFARNQLMRVSRSVIPEGVNEYGMKMRNVEPESSGWLWNSTALDAVATNYHAGGAQ